MTRLALVCLSAAVAAGAEPQALPSVHVGAGECVIVVPLDLPVPELSRAPECDRQTAPASTFKIPHALIALQAGVIEPGTVGKWDGRSVYFATWKQDHTLDSAMKSSVYPFFQRTARLIGPERMRRALTSFQYSSDTFDDEDLTTFWTSGDLVVSPREQLEFLRRMFSGKLPVDSRHVEVVKRSLVMPRGRITNAAGVHDFRLSWPQTTVRAKTGNSEVNSERVSWLVGHLEAQGSEYVFASRVRLSQGALAGTAGAELALRVLNKIRPPVTERR